MGATKMYKFGDILLINNVIEYNSIILPRFNYISGVISKNYDFPDNDEIVMLNGTLCSFMYGDNFGSYFYLKGFPCITSNLESRFLPSNGNKFPFCDVTNLSFPENSCTREEFKFLEKIKSLL
jgi:hypothetical protein